MQKIILSLGFFTLLVLSSYSPSSAQNIAVDWATTIGSSNYDLGSAIAIDQQKNIYVAGSFSDTMKADSTTQLISNGGSDMFITKFDNQGKLIWAKNFGSTNADQINGIDLDQEGNIYVTGYISGEIEFNSSVKLTPEFQTAFVTKLDSAGNAIWAAKINGTSSGHEGKNITVDTSGNVYSVGEFFGSAEFTTINNLNVIITARGSSDVYIWKLNNKGEGVWAKGIGGVRIEKAEGVTIDVDGNVYATGSFQRACNFDPDVTSFTLTSGSNSYDAFILKLNNDGEFVWAKQYTGPSPIMAGDIAIDKDNNLLATGIFAATTNFDPSNTGVQITSGSSADVYVTKMDTAGNLIWAKSFKGNSGQNWGYAITSDFLGNIYTTGFFSGTVDFNPNSTKIELTSPDGYNIFIAKQESNGNTIWAKSVLGSVSSYSNWGTDIVVDGSSNIYSTGTYTNTVNFDPNGGDYPITSYGAIDAYVHKWICVDTNSSTLALTTGCLGVDFMGTHYTEEGTYEIVTYNQLGCDSTVFLTVNIELPEALISVNEQILSSSNEYHAYQWMLRNEVIANATEKTYHVKENGEYKLIVFDESGCSDTSEAYFVNNATSINENLNSSTIQIYPNPATSHVYIKGLTNFHYTLTTISGAKIKAGTEQEIDISLLSGGSYLLQIYSNEGELIKTHKVTKIDN